MKQIGVFETLKASQYLQQLCKHFAHKVEVSFDATAGWADLPPGRCTMRALDGLLEVTVTADGPDGLASARAIIDDHLVRFAHREEFSAMDWRQATDG